MGRRGDSVISEKMLKDAAAEADRILIESLVPPEKYHPVFSRAFTRKMQRLARKTNHRLLHRMLKYAACLAVLLLLSGSAFLTFHAEARGEFVGWLKDTYDIFAVYHAEGAGRDEEAAAQRREDHTAPSQNAPTNDGKFSLECPKSPASIVLYNEEGGRYLQRVGLDRRIIIETET